MGIERLKLSAQRTKLLCTKTYGFTSNPSSSLQKNFQTAIINLPPTDFKQPKNLTFHNLSKSEPLPIGSKSLLGLNLKFCLSARTLPNDINRTILRMARTIRTRHFLLENNLNLNSTYEKQIYVKNTAWHPPPAPIAIEDKLTAFEKALKQKHQALEFKNRYRNLSNLTPIQARVLQQLKNNSRIVIKPSDKNLGPTVLNTTSYIHQVFEEHLLTSDYRQLTKTEAQKMMDQLKSSLKNAIESNKSFLSESELIYFKRSLNRNFRLPIFYGLPKVHKNPFSLRPVVSTTNSLLAVFSTWLDYEMKELLPFAESFTKNSISVIQDIKHLQIPDNALLFSADAVSMYTNIDTQQALNLIRDFIRDNTEKIPENFPTALFLQILGTIMTNNIFSFASTFWLQLTGTAMGTPAACSYATISYGQHENSQVLPKFRHHLLYYKRYIDDIFGIWLPSNTDEDASWINFKNELNNWSGLHWKVEELSTQTVFLDLNITLTNSRIHTSTYQKDLNLYLYIPPLSAHPPSCLKGLIAGEMRRYWLQNSPEDYKTILVKFIERLLCRGHSLKNLMPILMQAANSLDTELVKPQENPARDDNTLFIHKIYHPHGLQREDIRQLYDGILKTIEKMTVAISRPTNLRDILTSAKLKAPPNLDIQKIIDNIKEKRQLGAT
jgi:hypothetical protein